MNERWVCNWCGAPLNEGERFLYELDLVDWEAGERMVPPHPSLVRYDRPIPTCQECQAGIVENHDQLIEQRRLEEGPAEHQTLVVWLVIIAITIFVVIGWIRGG